MVAFRRSSPAADDAHELLTEYFGLRAETFPAAQGSYQTSFPDPAIFEPPVGAFIVADDLDEAGGSRAVGCGGIRRIAEGPLGVRYEVKHVYLRPETRCRGWGRLLLNELELRAAAFGARELVLDTHHTLEAAGGLYASAGFVMIEPYNDNPNATRWYAKALS